jgi:malonate-semialdehyde dehydrogenase (acetylating)/methylmalonate-semialdehyde dehydrogenase
VDQVTTSMDVHRHEVFGPVHAVLLTDTVEKVIRLNNGNPGGLGTAMPCHHVPTSD